jgi:signal transduction histidine kinase/CheY-like chemotaxis protein
VPKGIVEAEACFTLLRSMPVALVVHRIDLDDPGASIFVYANDAVRRESRVAGPIELGKPIRETSPGALLPVNGGPSIVERWARTVRTGQPETLEFEYGDPDGVPSWYRAHYVAMGGSLVATIYENITERKWAERELADIRDKLEKRMLDSVSELASTREQLQMAQRLEALGRLAGGIAHDFNNMLSVILSASGLARRKAGNDEVRRELGQIEEASERAAALTKQLLAFSRRQLLNPRSVSLNVVVMQTESMLRRLLGENVAISVDLADDLERVLIDPAKLDQVLVNLAVNARDAMRERGGTLTVATRNMRLSEEKAAEWSVPHEGPWVTLTVEDSGDGMSPEVLGHIFEPFFTTKDEGAGYGLGLATVFGIVKQSDGHIVVESELGKGSRFVILLPPTEIVQEHDSIDAPPDSVGGQETILVVEDDHLVRRAASRVLASKGYGVIEAASAEDALSLVGSHRGAIDALLTDMVLPGINGLELARQLRSDRPTLRVLCMSGYVDSSFGAGAATHEGILFITKPFDPESLARKMRAMLDRSF